MKLRIRSHGTDARTLACAAALSREPTLDASTAALGLHTVHLLPIPSTLDGRHIADTDTPLDSLAEGGALIVGYALPASVCESVRRAGGRTLDASTDELFTKQNARLTAIGTLGYLLTHTDRAPDELRVGILGYGRIGGELCRLLLFLGAYVRVFSGKDTVRRALGIAGVSTSPYPSPDEAACVYDDLDVLVNTAPTGGLVAEGVRVPLILELASGDNLPREVAYTRLPSLPRRMYPTSAGEVYAQAVLRFLEGG